MEISQTRLNSLRPGDEAIIYKLECTGAIRRRLNDLGFAKGSKVCCAGVAPFGDPKAFYIKGALIALREEDSERIIVYGS